MPDLRYTKAQTSEVVDVDEKERTVKAIITTDRVDSDKEVVVTSGLNFKRFQTNPVVLFMHDGFAPPVGKSLWQKVKKHEVLALTRFAETDFAEEIFQLFLGGFLRAWSIGMDPGTVKVRDVEEADIRKRKDHAGARRFIESADVVEYSAVTVPANEDAVNRAAYEKELAAAYSKGLIKHTAKYITKPEPVVVEEDVIVRAVEIPRVEGNTNVKEVRYTEAELASRVRKRLDFLSGKT